MKLISSILIIIAVVTSWDSCKTASNEDYSFFVAGHVYGNPMRKAPGLHPPFVKEFELIQSYPGLRFGVFTGDIVYYSRDSYWNAVDREITQLNIPVHFAAGTHDEGHKTPYKERYGNTYYAFEQKGDLHIVLNPGLNGWNIQGAQLEFLASKLNQAKSKHPIFIYFHQALWWTPENEYKNYPPNSLDGRAPSINFWDTVIPLLQKRKEPIFCFAGDVGAHHLSPAFFKDRKENIHLIASGMGNQQSDNFLLVSVSKSKEVKVKVKWLQSQQLETVSFK